MNKRSGIESRKKIIAAAIDVFSGKGYAKASIREIAEAAGISIGGVYLYFRNKEELYLSLLKNEMHDSAVKTEEIVEHAESPAEALSKYLEMHLEYALKHRELILLHIRERGFTFGMDIKKRFFRNQRKLIEKIIADGIRKGEFRRCNAGETAKILMGALRGIVLTMALDNVVVKPGILNDFVLNGLMEKGVTRTLKNPCRDAG